MKVFCALLFVFFSLPSFGKVIGSIEGVVEVNGKNFIGGWACDTEFDRSINVHVYLGARAGQGAYLKGSAANRSSDVAVKRACGNNSSNHRFLIPITDQEKRTQFNKPIFMHGISPAGTGHNLLANSGTYKIPSLSPPPAPPLARGILGGIERVIERGGRVFVEGWACDIGTSTVIPVHMYLEGPAGSGTVLKGARASLESSVTTRESCRSKLSTHNFSIEITGEELVAHKGKTIFIHGISKNHPNRLIGNSGNLRLPTPSAPPVGAIPLSSVVKPGQNLTIAANQVVEIDTSVNIDLLTVEGTLRCPPQGSYKISTSGILVRGQFICGSENQVFEGTLDIAVRPGRALMNMGEQTIAVVSGGTLRLFGQSKNAGWKKLNSTIQPGSQVLELNETHQWAVGDKIVIGPTSFKTHEAEVHTIKSISENGVVLQKPVRFKHWGQLQNFTTNKRNWVLDERAEVANLNRNIRIYSEGNRHVQIKKGVHLMVMRGGAAYIDSVEIFYAGRMGEMGRYPIHWHRAGNVNGQFVRNSSIHDTYQRCLTIHGTNYLSVENNVCYNHFGHGYFLEAGNEENNRLIGNLGMLSKRIGNNQSLLISDSKGVANRFSAPATFWISHPNNYVVDNVASGSEGTGFWMSFTKGVRCDSSGCVYDNSREATHRPARENTLAFNGNVAHSADVGITWDGAPDGPLRSNPRNPDDRDLVSVFYNPARIPTFNSLVSYKNRHAGLYFRGATVNFANSIFADNSWSLFLAYNQIIKNSAIVGESDNHSTADYDYLRSYGKRTGFKGIVLYDGPFELENIDFINFPNRRVKYRTFDYTPVPLQAIGGSDRYVNKVRGVEFFPQPYKKMALFSVDDWQDAKWSVSMEDSEGDLTRFPGRLIVPNHEFNDHQSCIDKPFWEALVCDYRIGLMVFRGFDQTRVPFKVTRSDGARTVASARELDGRRHNKFQMILNNNYSYTLEFSDTYKLPRQLGFLFRTERIGDLSPVVRFKNLGQCTVSSAQKVNSLGQFNKMTNSAYLRSGNDLLVKLRTKTKVPGRNSENSPIFEAPVSWLNCG